MSRRNVAPPPNGQEAQLLPLSRRPPAIACHHIPDLGLPNYCPSQRSTKRLL